LSHPRSRPSDTAIQQHRFCKDALSLIDQASRNAVRVPLATATILDSEPIVSPGSPTLDGDSSDATKALAHPSTDLTHKKYALMQHLPAGDYWTSLNADIHNSSKKLKDLLSLGHAELVAVFPVPSTSASATPVPTVGSYHVNKLATSAGQLPEHRQVSTGSFLDYGIWSSFAPSFNHSGEVAGRSEIGELLYRREQKKRAREEWKRERSEGSGNIMEVDEETPNESKNGQVQLADIDAQLEGLLPSDQVETLKDALSCLNLERAVNELLERNCRALQRLDELQKMRLSRPDGGSNPVDEGSEEWETGLFHHKFSIIHVAYSLVV
jgi:hypothetical protein